jgi:arabinose-5-phosphate isomerase
LTVQPSFASLPSEDIILERGKNVVQTEADALGLLAESMDHTFVQACEAIIATSGRVVITGMGKSGHIGRKWAATMAATGTPAVYVHPAEAAHGDLGMLVPGDILVVLSNSGNTNELRPFLDYARKIQVKVIGIASRAESLVMDNADIKLCFPELREACPANHAPTTSTTCQLALGDAIAMAVMDMRGISEERLKTLHPGGSLGLRLMPVVELMHRGARMPLVEEMTPMREVISTMTSKSFGIAGVTDRAGRLLGVITDGDLRRHFHELGAATAQIVMTRDPKTIPSKALAQEALLFLNENQITCAFVMHGDAPVNRGVPVGIVHVHDFLRIGLG